MDHPEGAGFQRSDRVDLDPRVRLEFRGTQLSSDVGLLVMCELDDALGLSDLAVAALSDTRFGKKTVHRFDGLFRQSVFGRVAGYEFLCLINYVRQFSVKYNFIIINMVVAVAAISLSQA